MSVARSTSVIEPCAPGRGEVISIHPSPKSSTGSSDGSNRISMLNPVDVVDLFKEVDSEIPWVWDGYLADGRLTLLAGPPKVGKTTLVYQLLAAVALGKPFLGREVAQANVLILGLEEHPGDMIDRLRTVITEDMRGLVRVQMAPLPYNESVLKELVTYIDENNIGLVVIDTLVAWWKLKDETDASEVIRQVSPLLDVVRRTNAAWLGLAHTRKGGGEHGEEIRGSSALLGIVDIALSMKRTEGGGCQRMLESFPRYRETPRELLIELKEDEYRVLGTPEEVSMSVKAEKLFAALTESDQTTEELIKKTSLSKQDFSRAVKKLEDKCVRSGKGCKGDPYRYRRNSIHPDTTPEGGSLDESNPSQEKSASEQPSEGLLTGQE